MKLILLTKYNIRDIGQAGSISMAKTKMREEQTDAVILDLILPDGSGMDLLQWIKKEYPKTIVIMFSNHSDKYHRTVSKENGADYFFDKVTEFETALKIISTITITQ